MWQETWWAMAGGIKSEYDSVKGTDVFEFWKLFDLWKLKQEREVKALKMRNGPR
jgi:hypothetical protein